jgi:hypothetical protein
MEEKNKEEKQEKPFSQPLSNTSIRLKRYHYGMFYDGKTNIQDAKQCHRCYKYKDKDLNFKYDPSVCNECYDKHMKDVSN